MKNANRIAIYICGIFLLALGGVLAIKSNLGASPVSSLPLSISKVTSISLGRAAAILFIIYVGIQILILRRDFKIVQLLQIIFAILFDESSLFDEEAKNEKLMTNSLYVNILNCDTHTLISLINETSSYDRLLEKIVKCLENISISKEDLERKKRVLISNEIFSFENLEIINEMIIDNIIFEGHIENDMIGLLKSLNYDELNRVISSLDLSNNCTVIMQGND